MRIGRCKESESPDGAQNMLSSFHAGCEYGILLPMNTKDMLTTEDLPAALEALLAGEEDPIANLANAAALLYDALDDVNWAGFYLLRGDVLILGPFCGRPACTRILPGKGVCGTALFKDQTLVVPDVHEFPGHIACDSASNSETVVPLRGADGVPFGVLDVDSPVKNRFDAETVRLLETAAAIVQAHVAGRI